MPTSSPKPCIVCRVLVHDGRSRCMAHRVKATGFTKGGTRHERGYGAAWDKLRKVILARDAGLCVPCKARGLLQPGNIVDHIKNKEQGGTDEESNLQTICKPCHSRKTAFEAAQGGERAAILPSWLPSPAVPVVAVCGPPASGKSTHVAAEAGPGDLVIDVDQIASQLTGKPLYHASREEVVGALRVRNRMLADLAQPGQACSQAWLITTAGTPRQREFWAEKLGREVVIMSTPKLVCIERIKADTRRPAQTKRAVIEAVLQWH